MCAAASLALNIRPRAALVLAASAASQLAIHRA
jgi:hypothetical protein